MAWFGLMSALFWVVVGSTVTLTVGTVDTLIGIGLSVVVYGLISGLASKQANRTGTSVALYSRTMFGQIGAAFAAGLFGLTITYYAVAEGSIVAIALHEYFDVFPMWIWYLIVVLYQAPLVLRGVRTWLDKINGALLPFYILGLVGSVVWAIVEVGYSNAWLTFQPVGGSGVSIPGWWFAFTVYMGVWIVVMMTWDIARFGRNEDAQFNGRVTFGVPFYIVTLLVNGLVGIFLASSNYQSFFARTFNIVMPRTFWLGIVAVVAYLMMLTDVLSWLLEALRFQGVIIVGWVAIVVTHIAWTRIRKVAPDQLEFRPGRVPLINPGGMTAWGLSSLVGIVLLAVGGDFGSIWAPPVTCVLAAAIYGVSLRFARNSWFVQNRPYDPRNEVDNYWQARVRCHHCENSYVAYEMDRDPANNHQAICLACASNHGAFLKAAKAEAREHSSPRAPRAPAPSGS